MKKHHFYFLLLMRFFYCIFAILVFSKLTSLGDVDRFLRGGLVGRQSFNAEIFIDSTAFMDFLGGMTSKILPFYLLQNIPYMLLGTIGIYYALKDLDLSKNRYLLLLLISMPSFNIWTSVVSKEAFGLFFMGIFTGWIIKLFQGDYRFRIRYLIAIYFCILFKPQYFVFVGQAIAFLYLVKWLHIKRVGIVFVGASIIIINIYAIYLARDYIDYLAMAMTRHFKFFADKSTRVNDFWIEPYDVFRYAPYGMLIAFWGPTVPEMLSKPTHLIGGIESLIICLFIFFLVLPSAGFSFIRQKFKIQEWFVTIFLIIGILFVHYPFGVFNPGSALRYRENFYILFIVLLYHLYSTSNFKYEIISNTLNRSRHINKTTV